MREKKIIRFTVVATRLFLGAIFLSSGLSKLIPFPGIIGPVWLEQALEPHGLGLFARFVAVSEAVVGAMLLTRFATLAALMLFPMLLCIFMVTVSLGWQGTPYVNAFFLVLNLGLLLYDAPRLLHLVKDYPGPAPAASCYRRAPRWDAVWALGMAAFLGGMLLLESLGQPARYLIYTGLLAMIVVPFAAKRALAVPPGSDQSS